jgi:ribose/xylose/arabinose/galactoside ABC-type transport system permease subunit
MEPLREIGRLLIVVGAMLAIVGAFLVFSGKLPFRLGRLPGDISWQGRHSVVYFPVVTCVVASVVLSLVFWLVSHFRK